LLWHNRAVGNEEIKSKADSQNSKSGRIPGSTTDDTASDGTERSKEIGGRGGLDPTRYGDWEKAGRCIDF
tara:strand:+ start:8142 stop:8351 length:210 start_codon:yes stop_codon:yes gene_type:complete